MIAVFVNGKQSFLRVKPILTVAVWGFVVLPGPCLLTCWRIHHPAAVRRKAERSANDKISDQDG